MAQSRSSPVSPISAGCSQEFLSLILSLSRQSPGNRNGLELPVVSKAFWIELGIIHSLNDSTTWYFTYLHISFLYSLEHPISFHSACFPKRQTSYQIFHSPQRDPSDGLSLSRFVFPAILYMQVRSDRMLILASHLASLPLLNPISYYFIILVFQIERTAYASNRFLAS